MSMQPAQTDQPGGGVTVGGVTIPPRVAGGGVIVILAIIFILQNRDDQIVHFLWLDMNSPLWVWFLIMFVAGGIVGAIASRNRIRRKALEKAASQSS